MALSNGGGVFDSFTGTYKFLCPKNIRNDVGGLDDGSAMKMQPLAALASATNGNAVVGLLAMSQTRFSESQLNATRGSVKNTPRSIIKSTRTISVFLRDVKTNYELSAAACTVEQSLVLSNGETREDTEKKYRNRNNDQRRIGRLSMGQREKL